MEKKSFIEYKGKPLVREGDVLYFVCIVLALVDADGSVVVGNITDGGVGRNRLVDQC